MVYAGRPAGAEERGRGSPHSVLGPRLTDRELGPSAPCIPRPQRGAGGEGGGGGGVCGAERGGEGVEGRAGWERAALRRVPCFPRGVMCILESATHA